MSDDIQRMSGQFVVSAGHTHPETLADGRTVTPGDTVTGVPQADTRLVEEGILIQTEEGEQLSPTDAAVKLAEDEDIDINAVAGTGQDGRVTVDDVSDAIEARDLDDDDEEDSND